MQNAVRIVKFALIFLIVLFVFDFAWVLYAYVTCSTAMEDTLSNIALIVAEENCIDSGAGKDGSEGSKLYSVKRLMIENAPLWLTYNDEGMQGHGSAKPTNCINSTLDEGLINIKISTSNTNPDEFVALTLAGSVGEGNNSAYYSYEDCPNRGESITITLHGKVNVFVPAFIPGIRQQSWDITKQITVIGMKFYKGKEES